VLGSSEIIFTNLALNQLGLTEGYNAKIDVMAN
jgi:hypothetical protein